MGDINKQHINYFLVVNFESKKDFIKINLKKWLGLLVLYKFDFNAVRIN